MDAEAKYWRDKWQEAIKQIMVLEGLMKPEKKVAKVMHEYGEGKLHSGSKKGPEVKSHKQAVAIAMSEAGLHRQLNGFNKAGKRGY